MKKVILTTVLKKWWVYAFIIVIIIGSIEGIKVKSNNSNVQTSKNITESTSSLENNNDDNKDENNLLTYETFINISMGEDYDDVVKSIGQGKEVSSSVTGDTNSSIYIWNGEGMSTCTVTFEDNIVTAKSQVGLLKTDDKITKEQYDLLKNNMTYDEVREIIGDGQVLSQINLNNSESITYGYINKDGSNAAVTFNGGKVILKAQFNLK